MNILSSNEKTEEPLDQVSAGSSVFSDKYLRRSDTGVFEDLQNIFDIDCSGPSIVALVMITSVDCNILFDQKSMTPKYIFIHTQLSPVIDNLLPIPLHCFALILNMVEKKVIFSTCCQTLNKTVNRPDPINSPIINN